ncbi:MAG: hypothetical protein KDM91_03420 [Verrucomicrobiae bacterium]|nr:hypothetical protein [Verrucomicrobiae bacterium]MCP5540153.1 hypothetical protein [Akkermansiaceae bacterium]
MHPASAQVVKITKPPGFGLTPAVLRHRIVDLRGDPSLPEFRRAVEFVKATPVEYLERWSDANAVFSDSVRLASVVAWKDGDVSFVITQPQYHGQSASSWEIEWFFGESGWRSIRDPGGQHRIFFHDHFGVIAIDALPRNCYIHEGQLLPFDVILCRPTSELDEYLRL